MKKPSRHAKIRGHELVVKKTKSGPVKAGTEKWLDRYADATSSAKRRSGLSRELGSRDF